MFTYRRPGARRSFKIGQGRKESSQNPESAESRALRPYTNPVRPRRGGSVVIIDGITAEEPLRRKQGTLGTENDREFRCPTCGARCTESPSSGHYTDRPRSPDHSHAAGGTAKAVRSCRRRSGKRRRRRWSFDGVDPPIRAIFADGSKRDVPVPQPEVRPCGITRRAVLLSRSGGTSVSRRRIRRRFRLPEVHRPAKFGLCIRSRNHRHHPSGAFPRGSPSPIQERSHRVTTLSLIIMMVSLTRRNSRRSRSHFVSGAPLMVNKTHRKSLFQSGVGGI